MYAMLGQMVEVQHLNGNTTKGFFHAISSVTSPEYQIVLKVPKPSESGATSGATWSGYSVVTILSSDIIQVTATKTNLLQDPIPSAGFATDGEIRKNGFNSTGRDLIKVNECWLDPAYKQNTRDEMLNIG